MRKPNFNIRYFDEEEKEMIEAFENGETISVKDFEKEKQRLQKAAQYTMKLIEEKRKSEELEKMKRKFSNQSNTPAHVADKDKE